MSLALSKQNLFNPYGLPNATINTKFFMRLLDTELLPDSIEDVIYRVESSKESYFTVSDSNSITVTRAISPKPENRLKVNSEYYVADGSIKYLKYDDLGVLDVDPDTGSIQNIQAGSVFTGKTDSFNDGSRILFGSRTHLQDFSDYLGSPIESALLDCRIGAHEYWNINNSEAKVYPVVKPWEVEPNREYTVCLLYTSDAADE